MTHSESALTKAAAQAEPVNPDTGELAGKLFFNREVSWLEFNRHVLDEGVDETLPVLEQLKFLSIFSTNLDEFFMIRVSGLKEQVSEGIAELSPDGMTPAEQIAEIYKRLRPMLQRQVTHLRDKVLPALKQAGITIEPYSSLDSKERKRLDKHFHDNLFPILTPQSVDSSHPFPYISNLSLNLGLYIEPNRSCHSAEPEAFIQAKAIYEDQITLDGVPANTHKYESKQVRVARRGSCGKRVGAVSEYEDKRGVSLQSDARRRH